MSKRLALLVLLLCPLVLRAAPAITVSASSISILGSSQTISLTCTLIDPNNTRNLRNGAGGVITVFVTNTATPGSTATCGPIYGNDVITDGYGNANTTYYKVQVFLVTGGIVASTPALQQFYAFTGSGTVDLSTATPLAPSFFTGPGGSVVMPGSLTVSGAATVKSLNNVLYADQFSGSDIGAQVNAAYAALPYSSTDTGKIIVSPPATNTCYQFSTPIVLSTNLKPVVVDFSGSCLQWIGATSSTIITLDTGTANTIVSSGIYNGHLTNSVSAGTTIGMVLGVSAGNGCQFCTTNMEVDGFQTGITGAGFNMHLLGVKIIGPSTAGSVCLAPNGWDDVRVIGGSLGQCNTLFNETVTSGPTLFTGVTFVEAKGGATGTNVYVNMAVNERLFFENCHFSALTIRPVFFTQSNGRIFFKGGAFEDDLVSGTPTSYATISGGFFEMDGADVSSSGESVTEFALFSGTGSGDIIGVNDASPSQIPLLWNNTYTGAPVIEIGTIGLSSNPSNIFSLALLRAQTLLADKGAACTNGELALSPGWQTTGSATVTAVAGNGQTCSWTITTGTTTAANPTVTDTLTNALPAATTVCELNIHGGTHTPAAGEGFQQTTLSATAPVFTFNGTPTAGGTTYFVTRRCGP